jgi:hypothetical protein
LRKRNQEFSTCPKGFCATSPGVKEALGVELTIHLLDMKPGFLSENMVSKSLKIF